MEISETTKPKPFCFVLMPFDEDFNDTYELGIKESCNIAGAYCERVDEQIFQESILQRIYNQIAKADIIIADMTGKNPNVFYEVGYAHALGKRTILLTKNFDDIPFDLKHFPHIIYRNKITSLKKELTTRLKWYIDNPSGVKEESLAIDVYLNGENLSKGNISYDFNKIFKNGGKLDLVFYNNSNITLNPENFRIGLISTQIKTTNSIHISTITLPNSENLHMLPKISNSIFPSAYFSYSIPLSFEQLLNEIKVDDTVIIRIFSSFGTRDYNFLLKVTE